mgnify:CR=1 FL=1
MNEWEERTANEITLSNRKYEYFKNLEQQIKNQKEVIDKVGKILNECKLLMPHEFDWQEQVDYVLDILKEVSK